MFIQRRAARVLAPLLLTLALIAPGSAHAAVVEDYADYQGQTKCSPRAKAGTKFLGRWLVRTYGGGFGGISRACGGGASEHKEGRAFDWSLDAEKKADRKRAQAFLTDAFATDKRGNEHAKARRMGIMYIIWNDQMYPAWDNFEPKPYLSSSCPKKRKCSKTLRHRDHVHISLTRKGGLARTSWYEGRVAQD